jgi:glycosyltransferase involved in cell wall biosynthesis
MSNEVESQRRFAQSEPARKAGAQLDRMIESTGEQDTLPEEITIVDDRLREKEAEAAAATAAAADAEAEEAASLAEAAALEEAARVEAEEARTADPLLSYTSDRNNIRLLFFTKDISVLNEGTIMQQRILEFARSFAEIHVIVLCIKKEAEAITARIQDNVWLYTTGSRYWWKTMYDAYRLANEQLTFAGGFRADMVIAEDPFESGVAGHFIASHHERPLQVHVFDDFFDPNFKEREDQNGMKVSMAHFVMKRAESVRTNSEHLKEQILIEYPKLADHIEVFPIYHNLTVWRDLEPTFDLHERYPQFKFIILHISQMYAKSHSKEVIIGVTPILMRYPTVGLVIVGNGPMRADLEKIVLALKLEKQVEFEPMPTEIISHMKTANVLVHLSEVSEEDEVVLEAATAKLPMILGKSGLARELFTDGESAYLCANTDANCVSTHVNLFLNENQTRSKFALNAFGIIFERIRQDYGEYLTAYRRSIERGVVVPETPASVQSEEQPA